MRSDVEIEANLSEAPLRTLTPEREAELVEALRAVPPPVVRWWATRVPLWQAAAACAAMVVAAVSLTSASRTGAALVPRGMEVLGPVRVHVDVPLFAISSKPIEPDIARWQPMPADVKEHNHE